MSSTPDTAVDSTTAPDASPQESLEDAVDTTLDTTAEREPDPQKTFADFGIRAEVVEALAEAGITHPFPIQALTLPVALARHDIIGQAKTGTGKTFGFGLPLLEHVVSPGEEGYDALPAPGKPQAVVVVPTRELAVQVAGDLETASRKRSVRILQVYGGRAYEPQIEALGRGVDVVVGTPGRMIDLMNQGHLDLRRAATVVLDEADEMLDLGFLPDVERILANVPATRHTMLFSATMPGAVVAMARRYMSQPTHIRAQDPEDQGATLKAITQVVYRAHALDKVELLARILQARGRGLTIVFARTKRTAAKVADELTARGFASGAIHGDLGQGAREQALRAFRSGKIDVLVATDVAARGIDVEDVTHVINYQCPEDEKTYLHRIGRTGRAGKTGTAVTFVDWDDLPRWSLIDKALDLGFPEPAETYSSSPHIHTDLDIPEGVKGTLPKEARTRAGLEAEELEDLGETGKRGGNDRGGRSRGGRDSGRGRSGEGRGRSGGRRGEPAEGRQGDTEGRRRRRGAGRANDPVEDGGSAPTAGGASRSGEDAAGESGEGRPRRRRNRRRTRGGRPSDGTATQPQAADAG